ncbi:MAG: cytidylate kinase-like family protein [Synergistaceae bacterium]|jgi:cytidylate kinase|nr:cytidylate kinase-like family protein [Synergistaceae bacterium]
MEKYSVTIAREYGSGGRIIGKLLAEELGAAFYDRELISLAAEESGLDEDYVRSIEQKKTPGFLYNLYMTGGVLPIHEQVFLAQSNAIRRLAEEGSCVIIGRCADYALEDRPNCIRVFVYAPLEFRLRIARDEYHEDRENLVDFIRKQDKGRASYYNFFTQNKWGRAQNYNLCIDSSIGFEASARVLKKYVEEFALSPRP